MKNLIRASVFLKPYVWQVTATLFTLLALTGLNLLVPRVIQNVIDVGLLRADNIDLIRSALILFGIGIASAILDLLNRYGSEWVAARVVYDLRIRMYDNIQYLPFTYHDHAHTVKLIVSCIEYVTPM